MAAKWVHIIGGEIIPRLAFITLPLRDGVWPREMG